MQATETRIAGRAEIESGHRRRSGWLAAVGFVGAVAASSCCIVPLLLVAFGISGAWIGNLAALEPFKPYIAGLTLAAIALGFWRVYFRRTPVCEADSYCARPAASVLTKSVLWLATVIVLLAITINWWAPLFY
jgi:mercuric ion transport protein